MNRKQLLEFEDFHWFPNWIRVSTTNLLAVLQRFLGIKEILLDLIIDLKNMNNIDLASIFNDSDLKISLKKYTYYS